MTRVGQVWQDPMGDVFLVVADGLEPGSGFAARWRSVIYLGGETASLVGERDDILEMTERPWETRVRWDRLA